MTVESLRSAGLERELLLLGLVRRRDRHGYELAEFVHAHLGMFFDLKRATAYHLLGKMEEAGWIVSREEREGRRPTRRVYAITEEGETIFQELLRDSLQDFKPASFPSSVALLFLDALPGSRGSELLERRAEKIRALLSELEADAAHGPHALLDHRIRYLTMELEWLDEVREGLDSP